VQLRDVNNRMQDSVDDSASGSVQHSLSRHRALLSSHERDFKRVHSRIRDARSRAELIPSVQRDIKCVSPVSPLTSHSPPPCVTRIQCEVYAVERHSATHSELSSAWLQRLNRVLGGHAVADIDDPSYKSCATRTLALQFVQDRRGRATGCIPPGETAHTWVSFVEPQLFTRKCPTCCLAACRLASRPPAHHPLMPQITSCSAMRGAEDAISIAIAAKEALVSQRGLVTQMQNKMSEVVEKFPALNNMLKKINYRKTRDQMVMAGVCSTCIIFILW
jgi:hypothetical protein